MPLYDFYDKKKKKEFQEMMTWSESVSYLDQNPHVERMVTSARLVTGVGSPKTSGDFKDRLKLIKKQHRGSTINV